MNKSELIVEVSKNLNTTQVETKRYIDQVFEVIGSALVDGDDVAIAGFGKFVVKERAGRVGRNPKTGETIDIGPSKSIGFKVTKGIKEELNA